MRGPWKLVDTKKPHVIENADGSHIATVWHHVDAKIIAAAPELLEALQQTLDALYNETHNDDDTPYMCSVKRDARAAIAKATGE